MTGVEVGWTAGRDWGGRGGVKLRGLGEKTRIRNVVGEWSCFWGAVWRRRFCGEDHRRSDVDLRSLFGRVMWWTEDFDVG